MSFIKDFFSSVKLGFKGTFDFSSTAMRKEFWYWHLFLLILDGFMLSFMFMEIALMFGAALFGQGAAVSIFNDIVFWLSVLVSLWIFLASLALNVRRLHDVGRSGWWILISFTIIGIIPLLYWIGFKKGTKQRME